MRKLMIAALLLSAAPAAAHEVWAERGADGKLQIWLGEPERPTPPGGDAEFAKLKAPKLVPAATAAQTRGPGYIAVALPPGDARVWDDTVFAPWDEGGKKAGAIFYARSGRSETKALMPLEFAPVASDGATFTLLRDGKPVAKQEVTLVSPKRWMLVLTTDAQGRVTAPLREPGRYILKAEIKDEGNFDIPGGPVALLSHVTTTSFVHR